MLAAKVYMSYLVEHEDEVYSKLADLGQKMREAIVSGFSDEGVFACCTGHGPHLSPGSSLAMVHFPYDEGATIDTPRTVHDPKVCDVELRERVLGPAMLLEDVHLVHGHGSAAAAHSDEDVDRIVEAYSGSFGDLRSAGVID